jgi:hypothetical protein
LPFLITSTVQSGGSVVITWASSASRVYQVQSRGSLNSGTWANLGSPITASGSSTSFTNTIASTNLFYRVYGN